MPDGPDRELPDQQDDPGAPSTAAAGHDLSLGETARMRWEAVEEAAELLQIGEIDAAIVALERVVAADADNDQALFFLGQAHFEAGRHHKALAAYLEALRLAPDFLGARIGAGHALRLLGRHEQAVLMGRHALALRPDDGDALFLLGQVHLQRGDNQQAAECLELFLQTGPEFEVALEAEAMLQTLRPGLDTGADPDEDSA